MLNETLFIITKEKKIQLTLCYFFFEIGKTCQAISLDIKEQSHFGNTES